MNATYIDGFATVLLGIMDRGIEDENDFIDLAITGEELRRALLVAETRDQRAEAAVQAYAALLPSLTMHAPSGLGVDLEAALGHLAASALDDDETEDAVIAVDEVLLVAAACVRAGAMARADAQQLGQIAAERAAVLAPQLALARPFASARCLKLGPDMSMPTLYRWLSVVAQG